ncbi:hypothetical protein LCGC14_1826430 [marine sediment metagenome]|uniref:Uncharacterized protein n=1 Tax=marine sediment metagenome TaxID=412755 RepID=A0A0F9IWZ0_9ZZZZ
MDFSAAQNQRDFSELLPEGTLARGIFNIKPHNADAGIWETPTKAGTGKFLSVDITIVGGKWDKRHVFDNINTENPNAIAVDIGHGAIKAILECSRGASPQNPQGYHLNNYGELNGAEIIFKIGIEPAKGAYASKNIVSVYLSPLQTEKDWARFLAGDMDPDPNAIRRQHAPAAAAGVAGQPAAGAAPRWAQGAEGAPAAVQGVGVAGTPAAGAVEPTPAAPAAQPGVTAPPPWMTQGAPAGTQKS